MILSSFLPQSLNQEILQILRSTQDPTQIRDKFTARNKNLWIVIKGSSFAFNISRGSYSAGIFEVEEDNYKSRIIIYAPPYVEGMPPEKEIVPLRSKE